MKEVSYLVLSDIHIGHKVNPSENIYLNLIKYLRDIKPLFYHPKNNSKGIKAIFIAGDLFDRYLANYSREYITANRLLVYLVKFCKEHDIALRVLEGTPLHDWNQSEMFSDVIKELEISVDFKYINDLYIEKNERLNLNILYVPDEYKHKAADTFKDIVKLMKKENLSQVDIAIMHGAFKYQIPMLSPEIAHDEEDFDKIVKYAIHIGHVHTYSRKGKIIAQGSFDRLAHGEEGPKYGVVATIHFKDKNPLDIALIENKRAMKFITFKYIGMDIKSIVKNIKTEIKKIPKGSSIRYITDDKDKVQNAIESISNKLVDDYNIKIILESDNKTKLDVLQNLEESKVIDTFSITRNNILKLVEEEIKRLNYKVGVNVREKAIDVLRGLF